MYKHSTVQVYVFCQGMKFVITVNTKTPKEELERKIKRLGGRVINKVDKVTAAVIGTKGKLFKM
jgi:NAD-dependent DNA ligase